MGQRLNKVVGSSAAIAVLSVAVAVPALAQTSHGKRHVVKHAATTSSSSTGTTTTDPATTSPTSNGETALTGSMLSSADAAAVAAVPGGTVTRATTETGSSNSSAAYEVHVTKADGSDVVVIEDASFKVLSTEAASSGMCGGPHGQFGGPRQ